MPTSDRLNISSRSRASASSSVCCDFRREMSVSTATTSLSPGCRLGAAHRQRIPGRHAAGQIQRQLGLEALATLQRRQGLREAAEQLGDGGAGGGAGLQTEHRLETAVAAHQHGAAQVGDAGRGAVEDGGQLAQQLLALALRAFLLGHVHRDHGAPARVAVARLDARQQPAPAELGMVHRVAHLGALAAAQGLLQAFVLGQRVRLDDVACDRLKPGRPGRRTPAFSARTQPAARAVEGGHADAGGVHQGADLQLRQVALLLGAAVLDHGHEAVLALVGGKATHPCAQSLTPAVGQGQGDMDLQRRGTRAQLRPRRTLLPGQQRLQVGRGVVEHHRHLPDQCLEGRVGAHDQPGLVEHQHAGRAEIEPPRQLVERSVGLGPGHVFGGGILQHAQQQRLAAFARHLVGRGAAPALAPGAVDQPLLAQVRHGLAGQLRRQFAPCLDERGLVFQRLQQHRVGAEQRFAGAAAEVEVGIVHRHQAELCVLQRRRKGRRPQHAQHLQRRPGADGRQRRRRRRARRLQLHAQRQVAADAPGRQRRRARVAQRHAQRARRASQVAQAAGQPVRTGRPQHRRQLRGGQAGLGAQAAHRRAVAEVQAAQVVEQQQRFVDAVEQGRQRRTRRQQRRRRQLDRGGTHRHRQRAAQQRNMIAHVAAGALSSAAPACAARPAHSIWRAALRAPSSARLISVADNISDSAALRMSNSDSCSTARTRSRYGR